MNDIVIHHRVQSLTRHSGQADSRCDAIMLRMGWAINNDLNNPLGIHCLESHEHLLH